MERETRRLEKKTITPQEDIPSGEYFEEKSKSDLQIFDVLGSILLCNPCPIYKEFQDESHLRYKNISKS